MDEIIMHLVMLETSMEEQGVSEEYGSWLLSVRLIKAQLEGVRDEERNR